MLSLETMRTIALSFVAIGQTCFVLLYATFPWWRSILGKALFYKALTLGVIVDMFFVVRLLPEWPYWDNVFVGLYFVLGTGVWLQFAVFLYIAMTRNRAEWDRGEQNADEREEAMDIREEAMDERERASHD